ncbi:MAG: sigma-54 interaction domain-containing protein, partial [Planctomycetota bacterium]
GESGTGKELVARAIHYRGPREEGPFVTVNCGAIPDTLMESEFFGYVRGAFTGANSDKTGFFQQAHKGTLFLDEIGDMDFDMQKKLLRVLQQGEVRPVGAKKTAKVDVRILCATNKDLRQRMLEGQFREDLFYRINVITVTVPPLRDRREDIALLVEHFIEKTAEEMGLPRKEMERDATALLTAYSWPGNVRELDNEVKKAMALSEDVIAVEDLSPHIQGEGADQEPNLVPQKGTLKETMEATEKTIIVRALDETGGNQTRAAKNLGISRVWLRKKMEKYGLLD